MKKILFLAVFSLVFMCANAQIKVSSNGYVGIVTTAPAYSLDINSVESRSYYSTRQPLIINHYGTDPRITSGTRVVFYRPDVASFIDIQCKTLYEYSDQAAKENIVPLSGDKTSLAGANIDKIKKLEGVSYTWKDDGTHKKQSGFLAQNVEEVIPEAVFTNDSTRNKSLAYSAIIPYLVEAIKEQQAQIEMLKQQIGK